MALTCLNGEKIRHRGGQKNEDIRRPDLIYREVAMNDDVCHVLFVSRKTELLITETNLWFDKAPPPPP